MRIDRRRMWKLATMAIAISLVAPATRGQSGQRIDAKAMFEGLAKEGKGFEMVPSVGPREPVYVVFDPQCRYCVKLWQAAKPISRQVRFVWMPIALLNSKSEPQGAAILSAPNPASTMEAHEASFSSGGLAAGSMKIDDAAREAVRVNSRVFRNHSGATVPTMVFRHRGSGQHWAVAGALDGDALKSALGL